MTPSSDPRNYARFIPKEELGDVAQWRFGAVGSAYSPEQLDERKLQAEETHQILLQARKDAYAEGLAAGRAQAQQMCQTYIETQGLAAAEQTAQQMAALVAGLNNGLEQAGQRMAQGVLELACAVARQVVRHELSIDPGAVRHVVAQALAVLSTDGKVATVRLSPGDMALLQQPLQAAFAGQSLVFVADAQMAQGDCRVECAGAVIDGSLAQRWARAVSGLGLAAQEMPGLEPDANDAD